MEVTVMIIWFKEDDNWVKYTYDLWEGLTMQEVEDGLRKTYLHGRGLLSLTWKIDDGMETRILTLMNDEEMMAAKLRFIT